MCDVHCMRGRTDALPAMAGMSVMAAASSARQPSSTADSMGDALLERSLMMMARYTLAVAVRALACPVEEVV